VTARATAETIHDLLVRTSRTFALAIPLLPEPTRSGLAIAYLLFRVADTLEDAAHWSRDARIEALAELTRILRTHDPEEARVQSQHWVSRDVTSEAGCRDLLVALPSLFAELNTWDEARRRIVLDHTARTADGMAQTLAGSDEAGHVRITSLEGLQQYCYFVAGIVGELVTALFTHDAKILAPASTLEQHTATLRQHERAFGEGLQLVNILKDAINDADDGRVYLPPSVPREQVIELARQDLVSARAYIGALTAGHAPGGYLAFTSLPVELAERTLTLLHEQGAGAKVPRDEVLKLLAQVHRLTE
jgi:farnesyl-diphosphate farnesyltransferase